MNTLTAEIDATIRLLEARLPASMENPENKRREKALRQALAAYFASLAEAFPYDRINTLPVTEVVGKVPPGPWDAWLEEFLGRFRLNLYYLFFGQLAQIHLAGSAQAISYGVTKLGFPKLYEGPPMGEAMDWAKNYGAQLVTKMDDETKARLAQVVSDGIKNKRGIEGLARDIRAEFTDMSKTRATTIAQTETNNALSEGSMNRYRDMGVDGKQWVVVGDDRVCEICTGNEAQGVIAFNEPFQSGDMQPAGHVNCRCTVAPARLNRND